MEIKINLNSNFKIVEEGERKLEIVEAKVQPSGKPEKLTLRMKDVEDGATLMNTYSFTNEKSLWALGILLNIALGLEDGGSFNTDDVSSLVGVVLLCEVKHSEYNDKTYANVVKIISRVSEDKETQITDTVDTLYGRNAISSDLD